MSEILKRSQVPKSDQWNLESIYENEDLFQEDFAKAEKLVEEFSRFQGTLKDADSILKVFQASEEIELLVGKLYVYGSLRYNQDLTDNHYQNMSSRCMSLYVKYQEAASYVIPEILSLPEEDLKAILAHESLKDYAFHLEKLVNLKPHTLPEAQERILATLGEVRHGSQEAYSIFTNAELKYPPAVDSEGQEYPLTDGSYGLYLRSKDRTLRETAFKNLHRTYGEYSKTLGHLLTTNMKDWITEARLRNYENSVEKALKPNNIPVEVFYKAIETIGQHTDLLHRYVAIKKKSLGLDEIHFYDLYTSLGEGGDDKYSFQEGVNLALEGLKPMGEDYLNNFKKGLEDGWIDKYENVGKRSGAYSSGSYNTMPFISLNFDGTLSDVSTFVHEMGHSMHSFYTRANQPQVYGDYSIFLAEVASTCNEKLLIHHLIETSQDKQTRIALIHQELEQIRTTVYRQLMFAEFEKITHEALEDGQALNGEDLDKIWTDLNRKYYGEDLVIDEELTHEWARIPHFYNDFYVYQYATGYAAASSFAKQILEGGQAVADRYIDRFLKAGCSKYPVDVLKDAGVDMTSPQALEDTLKSFKDLMDQLEAELAD